MVDLAPFEAFLSALPQATNETQIRELFLILASKGFSESGFASDLALGAEYNVSFKSQGLIRRGRIDSFVDNVLVEFKKKLATNLSQAEDQLRGYIAGAWDEDGNYKRPYVGVATDGGSWRVYAARPLNGLVVSTKDNVELVLSDTFDIKTQDAASLRLLLNRLFFRTTLLLPTIQNIVRDFGVDSPAFLTVAKRLEDMLGDLDSDERVQLYRRTWEKDLQVAYGSVEVSSDLFVRHTYLAVLARLLVWTTLERRNATITDLRRIYDGTYFTARRVGNFVEDDYFHWHRLDADADLAEGWKALVAQLTTYDLSAVSEDILKPLYEALVDPEMRHDLGEFYTPDWLAARVVDRMFKGWEVNSRGIPRLIDPACGSGTFLRASIHRIRAEQNPEATKAERLDEIVESVQGIDVHPLAVVVSKATYLLAISDLIDTGGPVIHLPVYMANSLAAPPRQSAQSLFGEVVGLEVGDGEGARTFDVPLKFVEDSTDYDAAIDDVVKVSRSIATTNQPSKTAVAALHGRIGERLDSYAESELIVGALASMSEHLVELIRANKDTIYGFLLRNRYRSVLLHQEFDMVVGNPPWLTFADIEEGPYRTLLMQLNKGLEVAPRGAGQRAHTEIATIFMFHVWEHFIRHLPLDEDSPPQLGFVMPRSLFQALLS